MLLVASLARHHSFGRTPFLHLCLNIGNVVGVAHFIPELPILERILLSLGRHCPLLSSFPLALPLPDHLPLGGGSSLPLSSPVVSHTPGPPWRSRPRSRTGRYRLVRLLLIRWLVQRHGLQEDGEEETNENDAGSSLLSPNKLVLIAFATKTDFLLSLTENDDGAATAREIGLFLNQRERCIGGSIRSVLGGPGAGVPRRLRALPWHRPKGRAPSSGGSHLMLSAAAHTG